MYSGESSGSGEGPARKHFGAFGLCARLVKNFLGFSPHLRSFDGAGAAATEFRRISESVCRAAWAVLCVPLSYHGHKASLSGSLVWSVKCEGGVSVERTIRCKRRLRLCGTCVQNTRSNLCTA